MRLGASYNFFNGEEHLAGSIRSIRSSCHHINVVFQHLSNAGENASATAISTLQDLANSGLVDEVLDYTPDSRLKRQANELAKRELGMRALKRKKCSHFLGMDADEFYRENEIVTAKNLITKFGYKRTSVDTFFHLKSPRYRALDTTRVVFICRLNMFTKLGGEFPVEMVDPTRTVQTFPSTHNHFETDTVAMYHMNFVRRDLGAKLRNSSTTDVDFLNSVRNKIDMWEYPEIFEFPGKGEFQMAHVENEFGTFDPLDSLGAAG